MMHACARSYELGGSSLRELSSPSGISLLHLNHASSEKSLPPLSPQLLMYIPTYLYLHLPHSPLFVPSHLNWGCLIYQFIGKEKGKIPTRGA
ncbi:hypothetical protein BDP55DRAFT_686106 [Colletotrichum godetiae]|uniref:Uncharacterized protein n=1 Tax=Colletotrichum godetiae TaxID=1209918 RepID=A0AAJ0EN92_9PEZI|nr:uncharacterized protein BDP55DRAFT_686106 [Colletotrichum godetiae]KAK1657332.1 hypothetical protein BDP55DRAFT_686106 [Colletotrichum godetiae]